MPTRTPLISILIVTWNRREELARSIRSALAQTWPNQEVVVVDNASSDGTADMVRREFPTVRLVIAPRNLGCPSGRNFGLRHCAGEYIYLLDDDGWLRQDTVEICVARAEANPAIGVVMARICEVEDGRAGRSYPADQTGPGYRADFSGGCSLLRRTALDRAGVFPEGFVRQGEETDLSLRLLDHGFFCYHEPAAVMFHGRSPIGRDARAVVFYTLRNSNRTALRLWPLPWCGLRPVANLMHALGFALKQRCPSLPVRVLGNLIMDVWRLPGQRQAVRRATFTQYKQLERAPGRAAPPQLKFGMAGRGSWADRGRAEWTAAPASEPTCAVLVDRIGPYHFARLQALGERMRTVAIESFAMDTTYAWSKVSGQAGFERHTLLEQAGGKDERVLARRIVQTLTEVAPSVVAVPGWSRPSALAALRWCLGTGTPALVLSATFEGGRPRTTWKEAVKRRVVRLFSAGLGGGTQQAKYLEKLGIPRANIFEGYDVVDNHHFAAQAEAARQDGERLRRALGLPDRYFLTICRFVGEKNLEGLLEAFARYQRQAGDGAWKLVLLGDGPLRPALLEQRERLKLGNAILMPGFKQYRELPTFYGLAGALVLPSRVEPWGLVVNEAMAAGLPVLVSNRCGCAVDLVRNGENGFSFDPEDPAALAGLLADLASAGCDRQAMGAASRRIIAEWTPERFASNLQRAAEAACSAPRREPGLVDRFLLWALLQRGKEAA